MAVLAAWFSGCVPHHTLRAASPTAPPEERVKSYNELRPVNQSTTVYMSLYSTTVEQEVDLADGRTISHAEDLLPVVAPDSKTAEQVRRHDAERDKVLWTFGAAMLSLGGGLTGVGLGVAEGTDSTGGVVLVSAGSVLLVASLVFFIMELDAAGEANQAERIAYATYGDSLRDYLKMCVYGLQVLPCEQLPSEPPPVAPPAEQAPAQVAPVEASLRL